MYLGPGVDCIQGFLHIVLIFRITRQSVWNRLPDGKWKPLFHGGKTGAFCLDISLELNSNRYNAIRLVGEQRRIKKHDLRLDTMWPLFFCAATQVVLQELYLVLDWDAVTDIGLNRQVKSKSLMFHILFWLTC